MLFFSVDPIAIESVMMDYLNEESVQIGKSTRNDDYLHYAANIGLGVHEHWDDFSTKKYQTIDYVRIDDEDPGRTPESPAKLRVKN